MLFSLNLEHLNLLCQSCNLSLQFYYLRIFVFLRLQLRLIIYHVSVEDAPTSTTNSDQLTSLGQLSPSKDASNPCLDSSYSPS